ncbi:DUF6907 domain-containing protein [Nocardia heshunensis]
MSDGGIDEPPPCPSWCVDHFDHLDPSPFPGDRYVVHTGLKSTQPLRISGLWPLTTSLTRTDSPAGETESYSIELHVEDDHWLALTPAETEHLIRHLQMLLAETRRVPATKQEGYSDNEIDDH